MIIDLRIENFAIIDHLEISFTPRAKWIENGLIDAGGTHEQTIFVMRRGGERLDAREQNDLAESEDTLRRLKEQGMEVFHTHLYKAFGIAAEMPGMEQTKRTAEIAHRLGLKVDTYIQWNTMMYETFFAEEPRARDWIQRDASGLPILLTYGYQQSYRYRPCFANQEYLDYLKKIVRYAVEEVRTDFIHFDNFDLNPEPDSCHDQACTRGFRAYLKQKYTPAQREERFGFENVDHVNPPQWNEPNPPSRMQIIYLARSAREGLMTLADARGRIVAQSTSRAHLSTLVAEVPAARHPAPTLYRLIGDSFGWLCLLGGILAAGSALALHRRRLR